MTADRAVSLTGLGFGDCGKGLATDYLARRLGAHTVVRFNGGAQAGHNVALPDGRRHTYSQFGAASFSAGVVTVLAAPVVVHPTALIEEARVLAAVGVGDALQRLRIDARCRVTTPFHQAAGRLSEWLRGAAAHGSCGAGFGETVRQGLAHPSHALHWSDLTRPDASGDVEARLEATRVDLLDRLTALRERAAWPGGRTGSPTAFDDEWRALTDPRLGRLWLDSARAAAACVGGRHGDDGALARLRCPGTLVFEGAQGMLLDERHGFHPHTTWSNVGPAAVDALLSEVGRPAEVVHLGVLRSYLTRHGAGPLPTEDAALDVALTEPNNHDDGWQGRFRRGHADAVLLRYAVEAAARLDGLVMTHLDAFDKKAGLRWCEAYRAPHTPTAATLPGVVRDPHDTGRVVALHPSADEPGPEPSEELGRLLQQVTPVYAARPLHHAGEFIERVQACTGLRVCLEARGPTHADVLDRIAVA